LYDGILDSAHYEVMWGPYDLPYHALHIYKKFCTDPGVDQYDRLMNFREEAYFLATRASELLRDIAKAGFMFEYGEICCQVLSNIF